MGLFGKKMIICPICEEGMEKTAVNEHWMTHVRQIPEGQGEASGQYTWECVCGPSGMKWPKDFGAMAGLALHMHERHGIYI
jgi:hypothetical protein